MNKIIIWIMLIMSYIVQGQSQSEMESVPFIEYSVECENQVVVSEGWYEAKVKIKSNLDGITNPKVVVGQNTYDVVNGEAIVSFKVQVDRKKEKKNFDYKSQRYSRIWSGKLTFQYNNELKSFDISQKYFVIFPVFQVMSSAVNSLYKDCGNQMRINVPALGNSYSPTFKISNPLVNKVEAIEKGYSNIVVFPVDPTVTIYIYQDSILIGEQKFRVREIPMPIVKLYDGSHSAVEECDNSLSFKKIRNLKLAVIVDQSFKEMLPKDARYRVRKYEVQIIRNDTTVFSKRYKLLNKELPSDIYKNLRIDDILIIKIEELIRMNYNGEKLKVNFVGEKIEAVIVE